MKSLHNGWRNLRNQRRKQFLKMDFKYLTTLILIFTASIIAQDYTLGLPNKNRFENLYLFTKTNNNYIYLVLLEQHERGNKVLKEYKSLDKKTNTEKVHQLKNPILFQNPILNTFHYDKKLYFLNFKRDSKTIEISSLSLAF